MNFASLDETKAQKAKQYGGAVTRFATMPVGVLKDFMQGGIVQAGKNLGPRLRNVATGTTLTNRAEVRPKIPKGTDTSTDETKETPTSDIVNTGETTLKTEADKVDSADDKTTPTTDTSSDRTTTETTADKPTTATTDTSSVRGKDGGESAPKTETKGDTKGGKDNT